MIGYFVLAGVGLIAAAGAVALLPSRAAVWIPVVLALGFGAALAAAAHVWTQRQTRYELAPYDSEKTRAVLEPLRPDAPIDNAGQTLLHLAVEGGSTETVSLLLHRGWSAEHPDSHGTTPLDLACRVGTAEMCMLLRSATAASTETLSISR